MMEGGVLSGLLFTGEIAVRPRLPWGRPSGVEGGETADQREGTSEFSPLEGWGKGAHFGQEGPGGEAVQPLGPQLGDPASPSPSLLVRLTAGEARGTQLPASWLLREASLEAFAISTELKALSFPPRDFNKTWPCLSRRVSFHLILWLIFFM